MELTEELSSLIQWILSTVTHSGTGFTCLNKESWDAHYNYINLVNLTASDPKVSN